MCLAAKDWLQGLAGKLMLCAIGSLAFLFINRINSAICLEDFSSGSLSDEEELMLAMFHYDMWQKSGAELGFVDFRESVKVIKENPVMAAEMLEVTDFLMSEVEVVEKEYSPTTMYEDYALNEFLFCKKILLFVREQNRDEYGLAMSYVFLGEASFVKSYGARPISIEWRLA